LLPGIPPQSIARAYIPDYYVNTGSYNAVEPSCST
jgi:hypothetical protein